MGCLVIPGLGSASAHGVFRARFFSVARGGVASSVYDLDGGCFVIFVAIITHRWFALQEAKGPTIADQIRRVVSRSASVLCASGRSPSPEAPEPCSANREAMLGTRRRISNHGCWARPGNLTNLTRNDDNKCLRNLMSLPFSRRPSKLS